MVVQKILSVCNKYCILFNEQHGSQTTESKYIFLTQDNIYCTIRISCHPKSHKKDHDFDFIADGTLDQLEKIENLILSFFCLEK